MNYSPLAFLRPGIQGVKFEHLSHRHHRGLKKCHRVIIMKTIFFAKNVFLERTIENSRFWGHPKFWGVGPPGTPPPFPSGFFFIFDPGGVAAPHGRKYEWINRWNYKIAKNWNLIHKPVASAIRSLVSMGFYNAWLKVNITPITQPLLPIIAQYLDQRLKSVSENQ